MRDGRPVGPRRRFVAAFALSIAGLLALPVTLPPAFAQQGTVRVQLASPTITIGESVRLAIVANGIDGELDASALEREFDVVGRSSSRDVQMLNGERRSTVTWVLELAPREVGVFTVPAVTVGGVESELVTLTVTEAPTGAARDLFVEARVDTTTPWVQSQVLLTLSVFRAIDIVDGSLGEPSGDGLDVRALGEDTSREEERNGRRYLVVERRFALFPQRSGPLVVEPIGLTVTVPSDPARVRGFFAPTRRLTRRTAPIELDVRPRPAGSGGWWLPATDAGFDDAWSGDGGEVRVGEPLTRTLRLRASGVLDAQLPDLVTPSVDGLAIYADDPVRASEAGPDGVESTLVLSLAVIPERAGTFELPAVTLDWFDADEARTRTASLPARTLTVLPGTGATTPGDADAASGASALDDAASSSVEAEDGEGTSDAALVAPAPRADGAVGNGVAGGRLDGVPARWRTLALAALVGWVLTGVALVVVLRRRGGEPGSTADDALSGAARTERLPDTARNVRLRVERSARDGDAPGLARAVLERAASRWPDDPPRSLAALARRVERTPDAEDARALTRALAHLDAAVYGGTPLDLATLDADALPSRLERALSVDGRRAPPRVEAAGEARALPPL